MSSDGGHGERVARMTNPGESPVQLAYGSLVLHASLPAFPPAATTTSGGGGGGPGKEKGRWCLEIVTNAGGLDWFAKTWRVCAVVWPHS